MNQVKSDREVRAMREGGRILAAVLRHVASHIAIGATTAELASQARSELAKLGGKAAFLGYQGFPDVICISVNDEVVHGIPGDRVLGNGDLVGLDFGVIYEGMITDSAITVGVGDVPPKSIELMDATKAALDAGIAQLKDGVRVGDISEAIERKLRKHQLGVVEDLIGHGVGHALHEEPGIPNYGRAGSGPVLRAGMTLAIEPMATLGTKDVRLKPDGWTIVSADGSLAAHFEHSVLVTPDGCEVLTV